MLSHKASRRLIWLVSAVATGLVVAGCSGPKSPWDEKRSPRVLVSIPPLASFALNIVDPQAEVKVLMMHTGPHNFDPTPQDTLLLRQADIFFINGLSLDEGMAKKARGGASNPGLPIIELGEEVPDKDRITGPRGDDPHVWLGIPEAIQMVKAMRDELKKKYPDRAKVFEANAATYIARLEKLHKDGKEQLAHIKKEDRRIIPLHDFARYFARSFDLEVVEPLRNNPEQEVTAQALEQIAAACKEAKVHVIVTEPQYTDQEAKSLRRKLLEKGVADVVIVQLDPMETADPAEVMQPEYYEKTMRANLRALAEKLK